MHLISYDIQDDRLRIKIARTLIRYGLYRMQYSVFMGNLKERSLSAIRRELETFQKEKAWSPADSLLVLPLHQYTSDNLEIIGKLPDDWDLINQKLHTLIL